MEDSRADRPTELRIKASGWKHYANTFAIFLVALAVAAYYWGAEAVVLIYGPDYQSWGFHRQVGIGAQLEAIVVGGAGVILALGILAFEIYGAAQSWRRWRQLRSPSAFVDAEGIRFEARRPLSISWPEVERLELRRVIIQRGRKPRTDQPRYVRTVTALYVHIARDSAVLKGDPNPIPSDRRLWAGALEKHITIPYDDAIEVLQKVAGSRLEITEKIDSRRTP